MKIVIHAKGVSHYYNTATVIFDKVQGRWSMIIKHNDGKDTTIIPLEQCMEIEEIS